MFFVYTSSVCLTTTGSSATGVFSSIKFILETSSLLVILPLSCLIALSLLDTDGAAGADAVLVVVVVGWTGAGAAVVVGAAAATAATGWGDVTTGAALVVAATRLVGTAWVLTTCWARTTCDCCKIL